MSSDSGSGDNLGPRFIGPFRISTRVGKVAYWIDFPNELSQIHNTIHVSQLQKCVADESAFILLDDIWDDDRLNYLEILVVILDRKTKVLCNKEVSLFKVWRQHRKGSEWTSESERRWESTI